MATGGQFGTIFDGGTTLGLGPAELLGRFTDRRDEGAFAALVDRHGPMVLATCRRILPDHADADDAFQATFLILARQARTIYDPDRLAPWLHGVARRVAVRARTRSARRSEVEGEGRGDLALVPHEAEARELRAVLDEELSRLPAKYRDPLVLCYLEGLTHDEAADQLRWPVGTVRSRLAGGRDRLRGRLTRRGFGPGALAILSPATTPVSVVSRLLQTATARLIFTGGSGKGASSVAALLAQGVLTSMFFAKIQTTAIATLAVAATLAAGTTGVVVARQQTAKPTKPAATAPAVAIPESESSRRAMTPAEIAEYRLSDPLIQANERIKALEAELATATRAARLEVPPADVTVKPPGTEPANPVPPVAPREPAFAVAPKEVRPSPSNNYGMDATRGNFTQVPQGKPYGDTWVTTLAEGRKILIMPAARDRITIMDTATGDQKAVYHTPENGSKLSYSAGADGSFGLVVEGSRITEVAAFVADENKWYPQALAEPALNKTLFPMTGKGLVQYAVGRHLYAFSNKAKRWGVLELTKPFPDDFRAPIPGLVINPAGTIIPEGDILHIFSAETGQWSHVNYKQAQ